MTQSKARLLRQKLNALLDAEGYMVSGYLLDKIIGAVVEVYRPQGRRPKPAPAARADGPATPHSVAAEITPHQELTAAVAVACHLVAGPYAGRAAGQLEASLPGGDQAAVRQMARDVLALYGDAEHDGRGLPVSWWYAVRCAGLPRVQPPSPDALVKTIGLALEWQRAGGDMRAARQCAPTSAVGSSRGGWPGAR